MNKGIIKFIDLLLSFFIATFFLGIVEKYNYCIQLLFIGLITFISYIIYKFFRNSDKSKIIMNEKIGDIFLI